MYRLMIFYTVSSLASRL